MWERVPADAIVFTDENVARHWPVAAQQTVVLPPGEHTKSVEFFEFCHRKLAELRATRKTPLVAFGGGVIGDLVGFVAATYMRGVPYIQVPTTLLAQVDSSVGGKVAIDLPEGKNLVGAFYTPREVLVSTEYLSTLDPREYDNGMAEVWKYGAIMDAEFFEMLEPGAMAQDALVRRCVKLKAKVVEADEFETTGLRAILNFGHTIGHAIEKVENYAGHKHGEAIAMGMVAEAKLGEALGMTPPGTSQKIEQALSGQRLPTRIPRNHSADALLQAMAIDKKAGPDGLAFSLLTRLGACKLVQNVDEASVREVLETCWA
ncbi:MAG: 3-dehydroquinate synthase [Fimbriimonadaceae bacterium]|nr:3-dehydroquinate synthase [Fimbriimonadaceae bacterium]